MIGETLSHYQIVERIGEGGMGVVYRAHDLRLDRTVALKFLPPELWRDDGAMARFRNEARAASALDHPGICAIHDIDETVPDRPFIVMAFCDGETLKQRLAAGPLALAEGLRTARQVAEALVMAHRRGIVHRDIKPANLILTSDGGVKIVDFGVAKLAHSPAITRTGLSVGTPAYMSPEQARGEDVDQRTDLWSLGAVLYEIITGRPPFRAQSAVGLLGAILHDDPAPMASLRPGTPEMVIGIVHRLLARNRNDRYSTAAEVSEDLRAAERAASVPIEPAGVPTARRRWSRRHLAIGLAGVAVVAMIGAIALMISRRVDPNASSPAAGTSAAAVGGVRSVGDVIRIAVLPFTNLGSPDDEFFAAGMTEEITSRLAGVRRLGVPSTTTVSQYDRRGKTLRQIGSDLRVDYVVEGSVRWARLSEGSRVVISPRLVRVADDTSVWSQRYETTIADVFKVQSDISHQITGALEVVLDAKERQTFDARPTRDDEAYLAYLRGLTLHQQGPSNTSNQAGARANLEQAVARDPRFALAWSRLARVYAAQYNTGALRTTAHKDAARDAARKALDLQPGLPEAHLALSHVLLIERDYDGARRELDIASAGLPNSSELFRLIGGLERRRGRWSESLAALTRAFDLDPSPAADDMAVHYLLLRQYSEAERFPSIMKTTNREAVAEAWRLFSASGDIAAARHVLEPALATGSGQDSRIRGLLARLEWFDGRNERALELIDGMDPAGAWLPANFRFPAALAAAQVYDSMNQHREAITRYAAAAAALEEKLRSAPEDYQVEGALGLAYAGLGRGVDAVRHGERAVTLLPLSRDAAEGPLDQRAT